MSGAASTSQQSESGRSAGRRVAVPAMVAGILYIAGYYLPLVSFEGDAASLADGESASMWVWVIPGALAVIAALMAVYGRAQAGAVAAGIVLGVAGFTLFELSVVQRFAELTGTPEDDFSKGAAFWGLLAAAIVAIIGALMVLASLSSEQAANAGAAPAIFGGLAFVGVPLAVLLPDDGVNPFTALDDGVLQAGLLAWALLAPALGMGAMLSRRRSGALLGLGVAIGHLGFSVTLVQLEDGEGGIGGFATGHSALYHAAGVAAALLAVIAVVQMSKAPAVTFDPHVPGSAPVPGGEHGRVSASWGDDPYGRHQFRWYDGTRWTAQVSDNGLITMDEPVPSPAPPGQWQPPRM